ncbi:MAG: hypothetical protein ACPGO5_01520 [Patescibacteria group bacterium]
MPNPFRLKKSSINTKNGKMAVWKVSGNVAGATTTLSDAAKSYQQWNERSRIIVDISEAVINSSLAGQILVLQKVSKMNPFLVMTRDQKSEHADMIKKVFRKAGMRVFITLKGAKNAR